MAQRIDFGVVVSCVCWFEREHQKPSSRAIPGRVASLTLIGFFIRARVTDKRLCRMDFANAVLEVGLVEPMMVYPLIVACRLQHLDVARWAGSCWYSVDIFRI